MRKVFNKQLNKFRLRPPAIPAEYASLDEWGPVGAFSLIFWPGDAKPGVCLKVIASAGEPGGIEWEHVSVSIRDRCPTWDEMCWVKDLFWDPEETVIQFHPPRSEYVNHHPFCLHLWKPMTQVIPSPPAIAVGPVPVKEGGVDPKVLDKLISEVCNARR